MWGFLERPSARVIFHGSSTYEGTGALAGRPCINISPDFSLKRQDLLPQKSGFVGSEIKFCGGANVRGIPGKASFWLSPPRGRVSLFKTVSQSTVEMKIEEEISGRQTVSIKPHSRLTNKLEEGPKEHVQTAPAKYLDFWIQNNIEYQYLFVLKTNIYDRICLIQEMLCRYSVCFH